MGSGGPKQNFPFKVHRLVPGIHERGSGGWRAFRGAGSHSEHRNCKATTNGSQWRRIADSGMPGGSVPWSIIILLTGFTLIPSILVCMTPFARLLIVFHFLRQALGLQTTPSNQTLIGLSMIMTFFLMQPVANKIYVDALCTDAGGTDYLPLKRSRGLKNQFVSS